MEGPDIEDLVERTKMGAVSDSEIAEVVDILKRGYDKNTYKLLYVIGRSNRRQYESLLAAYIDFSQDPQVAALALSILCVQWGLSSKYQQDLLRFLKGIDWDSWDEVKDAAITATGEHLRSTTDCSLLRSLLAIAESIDNDDLESRFAVEALARALGEPYRTAMAPNTTNAAAWVEEILARARNRLTAECNEEKQGRLT